MTNIAYNRYVLDVGNTGDILDLRVATAPCLLGYGEVGVRLTTKPDNEVDRTPSNKYCESMRLDASVSTSRCLGIGRLTEMFLRHGKQTNGHSITPKTNSRRPSRLDGTFWNRWSRAAHHRKLDWTSYQGSSLRRPNWRSRKSHSTWWW